MPLDPKTIGSGSPRTLDGREYPDYLRPYEAYDEQLLPFLAALGELTPIELAAHVEDPRLRSMVPRWMASAEWRSLIERTDTDVRSPRTYRVTELGRRRFED